MADIANNAAANPHTDRQDPVLDQPLKKLKTTMLNNHPALSAEPVASTGFGQLSELQKERLRHKVDIPDILKVPHRLVDAGERDTNNMGDILSLFPSLSKGSLRLCHLSRVDDMEAPVGEGKPLNVGIVLSGGQAAGMFLSPFFTSRSLPYGCRYGIRLRYWMVRLSMAAESRAPSESSSSLTDTRIITTPTKQVATTSSWGCSGTSSSVIRDRRYTAS